jgi:amino acid adenylation domain-containing protein
MAVTSFAQERLWFVERFQPRGAVYNMPLALRLTGRLNGPALRAALDLLLRRHEPLRTRFMERDGKPEQIVDPPGPMAFKEIDLRHAPATFKDRLHAEAARPFDLAAGPVIRAILYRLDEAVHVLLLTMHHIASDGWSLEVLLRELRSAYAAFERREDPRLPPLERKYSDFAVEQRRQLQGDSLERQLAYWVKRLTGAPAALELPTDRPRPAIESFRGASYDLVVPGPLVARLRALAKRDRMTLFMVLMAAFQVLLSRWSGQDDVLVGLPIAGRRPGTETMVGFFVNMLVLRSDLSRDPSFPALMRQVRDNLLTGYEHQGLPFEKLVEVLQPERDLSRHPVFQVTMNHFIDQPPKSIGGLRVEFVKVPLDISKFDLGLSWTETPAQLSGTIEYATDLFSPSTIERMAGHLLVLLDAAATSPDRSISALPLLTARERQKIIEWNNTAAAYPSRCLHEIFAAQAARTPEALAVVQGDRRLSYGELDRQANRLARHLRSLGIGPEIVVGLCVDRSPDFVLGMLGILKAGGAYLPIDPGDPRERIAHVMSETRAPILLTQLRLSGVLPTEATAILYLDADWGAVSRQPGEALENSARLDNLAHVIYTSGSTGRPLGIVTSHRAAANLLHAQHAVLGIKPASRVLQFAPLNVDRATWEVLTSWQSGATLVMADPQDLVPGPPLAGLLAREEIGAALLPPSALAALAPTPLPHLETLIIAGDAWDKTMLARWPRGLRVLTAYGATEAGIYSMLAECTADSPAGAIGRPIANMQAYVLDRHREGVPVGVSGELYVGGAGLARGYLDQPGPMAERFVQNPFDAGEHLYRTGDRVRRRDDGTLEYLGRLDRRVTIDGFRIEPGEIEAALSWHENVAAAAVVVRADKAGKTRLEAYVATAGDIAPDGDELRRHVGESLPEYMVPSAFIVLDRLPLTAQGEIDRDALAAFAAQAAVDTAAAPTTPTEEVVASIWAEALGLAEVGIRDNFFDLGGHSMIAMLVVSRLSELGGRSVPVRALFENPTVAELAAWLDASDPGGEADHIVLQRASMPTRRAICFLPTALGAGEHYGRLAKMIDLGADSLTCRLPGTAAGEEPLATIEDIAAYCKTRFVRPDRYDEYLLVGWSFGGILAYELARLLAADDVTVRRLVLIDAYLQPLQGPVLSAGVRAAHPDGGNAVSLEEIDDQTLLEGLLAAGGALPAKDTAPYEAIIRTYRTNIGALLKYVPRGYDGPLLEIRAAASVPLLGDTETSFRPLAAERREIVVLPGDHYALMDHGLAEVASAIAGAVMP